MKPIYHLVTVLKPYFVSELNRNPLAQNVLY